MPRKQRFKPSRKPKPMDAPGGESHVIPPSETAAGDQREPRHEENRGSMEAAGDAT